jgi:hypothetical protein
LGTVGIFRTFRSVQDFRRPPGSGHYLETDVMRMLRVAAVTLAALVSTIVVPLGAVAQTPAVEYCKALQGRYRQAVTNGKEVVPAASEAGANCPTNPNVSIPVIEKALVSMKVDLPKRP